MPFHDLLDIEKQGATRIRKTFAVAGNGECLAGETRTKHVKFPWDILLDSRLGDVSKRRFAEVRRVGRFCPLVPLTGVHAFSSRVLHRNPETANPGKQVDELK